MLTGEITYVPKIAEALVGIAWKEVNTKFKNDYEKTIGYVQQLAQERGVSIKSLEAAIENIAHQIEDMQLQLLGPRQNPPQEQRGQPSLQNGCFGTIMGSLT